MHVVGTGFRCNNACVFCAQGALRTADRGLDALAIERALADGPGSVAFVGGEPTLHDELLAWVARARALGATTVLVQTNARRLAYASYARALAAAGVTTLDVSLHGSTAAMHDYHTSVAGSFAQTVTGIAHARAAGLAVGVTTVVTRSNFRHLSDVVRVAHARGADAIHLSPAVAEGRALAARSRIVPAPELVRPHLASAIALAKALGLETLAGTVASSEAVRARFAGIGDVEPHAPRAATEMRQPLEGDGLVSPSALVRGRTVDSSAADVRRATLASAGR